MYATCGSREREMRRASWSFIASAAAAEGWQGGQGLIRRWRRGSEIRSGGGLTAGRARRFLQALLRRFFLSRAFADDLGDGGSN